MENKRGKIGLQDLKRKRDSRSRRSLREILQQGAGSYGAPLRDPAATSEPAAEISVKGRDEPVVRNLSKVKPRTPLLRVSSSVYHTYSRRRSGTPSFCTRWTTSGE
jgi:hypothetical protein